MMEFGMTLEEVFAFGVLFLMFSLACLIVFIAWVNFDGGGQRP